MKCLKCKKPITGKSYYGLHVHCFVVWFKISDLSDFAELDHKKPANLSSGSYSFQKTKDSFYHGQYLKYSTQLNGVHYILKVQEQKYPDLPATEYLCNKIASLLKLNVPEYYLICFADNKDQQKGLMTFVTKNFMQSRPSTLKHIYHYLPKGDKNYNCENIIQALKNQTGKLSDVESFVEICLFDSLIGNGDRHGRNLAIIDTGKTKLLAPMYDNPSFIGLQPENMLGGQFHFSGCIFTSTANKPKMSDYIKEFTRLNLKAPCVKFFKKVNTKFQFLIKEVEESEISEKRKQAFIRYLNNSLSELQKNLII